MQSYHINKFNWSLSAWCRIFGIQDLHESVVGHKYCQVQQNARVSQETVSSACKMQNVSVTLITYLSRCFSHVNSNQNWKCKQTHVACKVLFSHLLSHVGFGIWQTHRSRWQQLLRGSSDKKKRDICVRSSIRHSETKLELWAQFIIPYRNNSPEGGSTAILPQKHHYYFCGV